MAEKLIKRLDMKVISQSGSGIRNKVTGKKKSEKNTPGFQKGTKTKKGFNFSRDYLLAGAIALFTLLLYLHSLQNGFVDWDDPDYLRDNLVVHQLGWKQFLYIFTSFYSGNYHPLTTLFFSLEYAVSAYQSAAIYHFDNLCLHLINVILVFWFIRMISNKALIAPFVAFLFGIHPMHVESVAWISERKDLLYSAFFLAGLISYCYFLKNQGNGTASRSRKFYLLALLFFLFSLLSKSAAVVLPLVLLLIDFLQNRNFSKQQIFEKIPFFALSLLFGILAILSQESAIQHGVELSLSPIGRFFTVNFAIVRYMAMLFYPAGLSAYHPYPVLQVVNQGIVNYLPLLFNLLIIGVVIYSLKYSRKWFFGFFFFIVNIILVLQIIPVGGAFIAERYSYMAYIGLFYIIACLFAIAAEKLGKGLSLRIFLWLIFFMFSTLFSITSYQRILVWNNSLALFDDVVRKYPDNFLAYNLRASARKDKDVSGAIEDYSKSIALNPKNPRAFNNRGNVYSASGKYREALEDYNAALKFDSTLTEAFNNRGAIKAIFGDLSGALSDINKAIMLKPESKDAYRNRGLVRLQLHDLSLARDDWRKAAALGDELSVKLLNRYK